MRLLKIEFKSRLQLARHRMVPAARTREARTVFGHPSEQMFANLLDFYRIPGVRAAQFPATVGQGWQGDGSVHAGFFLPEFDLYVELTTMKQALVTRKNRKVKLLRAIYPHINIQVFYQKDFQALVLKYGLRVATI